MGPGEGALFAVPTALRRPSLYCFTTLSGVFGNYVGYPPLMEHVRACCERG